MPDHLQQLIAEATQAFQSAQDSEAVERLRVLYLGRKGKVAEVFSQLQAKPATERAQAGLAANQLKSSVMKAWQSAQGRTGTSDAPVVQRTLPGERPEHGHMHPITQFSRRVLEIWRSFGYDVHEGPELETAWFNFDGLNVPKDHPARDVQDTFFIKGHEDMVLRTHTSTVQLRWPKTHGAKPPFKAVELGKVYRHEATDATHESMFFHCDGILVDEHVTMAHLVTTLKAFMDRLCPGKRQRIRSSFFPFVEPGIELDLWWDRPAGRQGAPGKEGKWLEILGAGLVHPSVIKAMGLDPKKWQGFAFGMGLDRLAMLEYGVTDIRKFYNGDLHFLKQF